MPPASPLPIAVIPSRYGSIRFPGKPLALLGGKPMVQHVWERCIQSGAFSEVWVATEDDRILKAVQSFSGQALLTSPHCKTGTDRVAEVALSLNRGDAFVNVQGDEPLIHPDALRGVSTLLSDADVQMCTLVRPLEEDERQNPNVVKVVMARNGDALYFSRSDIPYCREPVGFPPPRYAHLGLYGYRRNALLELAKLAASPLEDSEKLEQLRALEGGIPIRCALTLHRSFGIDTPSDLAHAEKLLSGTA